MVSLAELDVVIKTRTSVENLKKVKREAKDTASSVVSSTERMEGSFRGASRSVLSFRGVLTGVSLGFGLIQSIRTLSEFERAMHAVKAISGATGSVFTDLSNKAKFLGSTTMFTASESAEGMKFLAQAGFNAGEIISGIGPSLQLAAAGMLSLGEAADFSSNILSTFNIEASNLTFVGDILARISARSNTSVRQMAEAMKYVGPVAAALDQDLRDVAAALGVLGDSGLQSSLAGTGLRQAMLALVSPTKLAQRTLESMNVDLEKINPAANSVIDVINELGRAQITAAQSSDIFGVRASGSILILTQSRDRLKELTTEAYGASGALEEMMFVMMNNLYGVFKEFKSSLEGLVLTLGASGLTKVLMESTRALTDFVRAVSGSLDTTKEGADNVYLLVDGFKILGATIASFYIGKFVSSMAAATIGIISYTTAVIATSKSLGIAATAQAAFNLVIKSNPYVFVATTLGAVLAAYTIFSSNTRDAKEATDVFNEAMKSSKNALDSYRSSLELANIGLSPVSTDELQASSVHLDEALERQKTSILEFKEIISGLYDSFNFSDISFDDSIQSVFKDLIVSSVHTTKEAKKTRQEITLLFDAFDSGKESLDGLIYGLAELAKENSVFTGTIESTVTNLIELKKGYSEVIDQRNSLIAQKSSIEAALVGDLDAFNLDNVTDRIVLTETAFKMLGKTSQEALAMTEQAIRKANLVARSLEGFQAKASDPALVLLETNVTAIEERRDILVASLKGQKATADSILSVISSADIQIGRLRDEFDRISSSRSKASDFDRVTETLTKNITILRATEGLSREIASNLLAAGLSPSFDEESLKGKTKAIVDLTTALYNLENPVLSGQEKGIKETLESMESLSEGVADAFGDAVKSMILDGTSLQDSLSNIARSIQQLVVELLVMEPLKRGLVAAFSGPAGSGGGLFGAATSAIGSQVSSIFTAHRGGVVGNSTSFSGDSALAANFIKSSLRRAEHLSILEEGEEVLPRTDPRHVQNVFQNQTPQRRNNSSGKGSSSPIINMYITTQDATSFSKGKGRMLSEMLLALKNANQRTS